MNILTPTVEDIRNQLVHSLDMNDFVIDKTGVKTVEIAPALFEANEPSIFGDVNWDYVDREIEWYDHQSLKVDDIPGKTPEIWNKVSSDQGEINSNYGHLIYSKSNFDQYKNVFRELEKNIYSRRALMIYNRPSMHYDYNREGMSDFVCTNAVQYLFRDDQLHAMVEMRSNDAVFGYKNDRAWQSKVLDRLANDLKVEVGSIFWYAGSLHVYERHFDLMRNDNG